MQLNLLVIRTRNPKRLAEFYSLFGLDFTYHRHGNSPMHYWATIGGVLLEIYTLSKNQQAEDLSLRLGFKLDDFEGTISRLRKAEVVFDTEPIETEFGFRAVVFDPDGRKIELYK